MLYSNDFFNKLEQTKSNPAAKANWNKQRFDLNVIAAGIVKNSTYLAMYQITWKEAGILFGKVPLSPRIPCFAMPSNGVDFVEKHIAEHYPRTVNQAIKETSFLMGEVSNLNIEVSPSFDYEYFAI